MDCQDPQSYISATDGCSHPLEQTDMAYTPDLGQQLLVEIGYEQTMMEAGHSHGIPMQPNLTGQLPMMSMNAGVGLNQQPIYMMVPQTTAVPMQPHLTGQPSIMSMNTKVGLGQYPVQMHPQMTGVMMTPGPVMIPNCNGYYCTSYLQLCQQGQHDIRTKYGPCGVITAIVFFPVGLLAMLVDVEKRCTRCGATF